MSAIRAKRAVAVGASAGGVEALSRLFRALPAGLPVPVFVVLHISPAGRSLLADIIGRTTIAPVVSALDGMPVNDGTIYVAPPDRHLIVEDGQVRLTRQPRENGLRPSIDVTFRSVAAAYGTGAVGVVLSGTRDDGSAGLRAIKERGGLALVQDPSDALYNAMPINALEAVTADAVLPVEKLAQSLTDLVSTPVSTEDPILEAHGSDPSSGASNPGAPDPQIPSGASNPGAPDPQMLSGASHQSPPSPPPNPQMTTAVGREAGTATGAAIGSRFTCPDCGGVLFESIEDGIERFRCSVGHVYSPESLDEEQARALEIALWEAVRLLQDRGILLRRMAAMAQERGQDTIAASLERRAQDVLARSETIRSVIERPGPVDAAAEQVG